MDVQPPSQSSPSLRKRTMHGTVVSAKMQKTVVVVITHFKKHPKYEKRYRVTKRYKAHHEGERDLKVGTEVLIEEIRPLSRDKRWRVVKVITETSSEASTPEESRASDVSET